MKTQFDIWFDNEYAHLRKHCTVKELLKIAWSNGAYVEQIKQYKKENENE